MSIYNERMVFFLCKNYVEAVTFDPFGNLPA